jgi:hypothetical protein
MLKRIAVILCAALALAAQTQNSITWTTLPDISGSSSTVQVATSGAAQAVQFIAPSTNTGTARWGDSGTSATRGGILPPGSGQYIGPSNTTTSLALLYVYVASGDKLTVIYGR